MALHGKFRLVILDLIFGLSPLSLCSPKWRLWRERHAGVDTPRGQALQVWRADTPCGGHGHGTAPLASLGASDTPRRSGTEWLRGKRGGRGPWSQPTASSQGQTMTKGCPAPLSLLSSPFPSRPGDSLSPFPTPFSPGRAPSLSPAQGPAAVSQPVWRSRVAQPPSAPRRPAARRCGEGHRGRQAGRGCRGPARRQPFLPPGTARLAGPASRNRNWRKPAGLFIQPSVPGCAPVRAAVCPAG